MATFSKRTYESWRVKTDAGGRQRSFDSEDEAQAYARELSAAGVTDARVTRFTSTRWQVRIRNKVVPGELTKTFATRAQASEWAKQREGEIAKREFIDYRTADQTTLGDLLRRYDTSVLKDKPDDHPDRSRIRKLLRHPITSFKMSVLQQGDFAQFRDDRLAGGFVEPKRDGVDEPAVWAPVKGSSVNKDLELMSRVIAKARGEWKLHLALNPASGLLAKRVRLTEDDERDRRLLHETSREGLVPVRSRRKRPHEEFELDPETSELLAMSQSEQQLLLRASRYPEWFRPRKKHVTAATLRARQKASKKRRVKARLRSAAKIWSFISFAIETGMRRGEILKLKWEHVIWEPGNGYLMLPGSITKNGQQRMVPLTLRARRILQTRPRGSQLVFDTSVDTIKLGCRRAQERVQILNLRIHDLRHEATSRLFERTNLRAEEIGSVTGHNDPRMLKRYYNKRPHEFVERFQKSFIR